MKHFMTSIKNLKLFDWFIIILSFFMVIGNSGFWFMPNLTYQYDVSQSLMKVPFDDSSAHYIYTNYFEPLLFGILGGTTFDMYILYVSFVSGLFFFLFAIWFINYHGKEVAVHQYKLFLVVTFPLFMIPFYWIGMDGMTMLLMLLVMINLYNPIVFLPATLLGIQHFEQGFLAFSIFGGSIVLNYLFTKDKKYISIFKRLAIIILSILIGKLFLILWFSFMDVGLSGDRNSYLKNNLKSFLFMWKSSWYFIAWSLLGVGWILVLSNAKKLWVLIVTILVVFLLTAIVGDQTRVGVILLFPSLFFWVMMYKELWQNISRDFVFLVVILYLLIPVSVVWGGVYSDLLKYDAIILEQYKNKTLDFNNFNWLLPFKQNLPLKEYKSKIELLADTPLYCKENEECKIDVKVTNTGKQIWQAIGTTSGAYSVRLSYHIESADGSLVLENGYRTFLPHEISKGVTVPLTLFIKKDLQKGLYTIKADMVQEGVSWFGQKDSDNILSIPLEVK